MADIDFTIFSKPETWPAAADLVFIADAITQLGDGIWSNSHPDIDAIRDELEACQEPPDRVGVLWMMTKMFVALLVDGSITAHTRPVGGSGTTALRNFDWDGDHAMSAVARGTIELTAGDGSKHEHWLFIDLVEFELLMLLYSPGGWEDNLYVNLRLRHDRLVQIVHDNLSTIARSRRNTFATRLDPGEGRTAYANDPTPEEFEAMFATAPRLLGATHQIALEERIASWLVARWDEDTLRTKRREYFTGKAKEAFKPYNADDHIRRAWTLALRERPNRFKGGRPTK